jgi:hypothetical protein
MASTAAARRAAGGLHHVLHAGRQRGLGEHQQVEAAAQVVEQEVVGPSRTFRGGAPWPGPAVNSASSSPGQFSIERVYSCGREVRQWYSGRTKSCVSDSDSTASRSSRKPRWAAP